MSERPPRRAARRRTAIDRDATVRLNDLDRQVLERVARFRVVTQRQLERLHPEVPRRTMRYRTRRLKQLGLLGVSRPYCDAGSEPQHWWPTRRGQALARGEAPPRRGERRRPHELALRHHAALSELCVVLQTATSASGLRLEGVVREREAPEQFEGANGRERAIAPDLTILVRDENDRQLLAHVEIDLGTMSHARLRTKLEGYLAYTQQQAWRGTNPYQPALLVITTSRARADTFRRNAGHLLASKKWAPHTGELTLAVCARARDMSRLHTDRCWRVPRDEQAFMLSEVLNAARGPYDRRRAAREQARRERDDERDRLLRDPEAFREHLRKHHRLQRAITEGATYEEFTALELLLHNTAAPDFDEQDALRDLGRQLADHLPAEDQAFEGITPVRVGSLAALADHYRRGQRSTVRKLAATHGVGPHVRRAGRELDGGRILDPAAMRRVRADAVRDAETREQQQQLCGRYLRFRDTEARRRARDRPLTTRLRHNAESYLREIDHEFLRICRICDEISYPDRQPKLGGSNDHAAAGVCAYCMSGGSGHGHCDRADTDQQ